jgi:hypothetical protein
MGLTIAMSSTDTSVTVAPENDIIGTPNIPESGVLWVEDEAMSYTSCTSTGTNTTCAAASGITSMTFSGLTRGLRTNAGYTGAIAHPVNAPANHSKLPFERPVEGRLGFITDISRDSCHCVVCRFQPPRTELQSPSREIGHRRFPRKCRNLSAMTHVRTSPYYPQSNGKVERWHKSLKGECIRPGTPLSLEDARRLVEGYVEHYNNVRLNSAVGYITPKDMLAGRQQEIHRERDRKLEATREQRRIAASGSRDR